MTLADIYLILTEYTDHGILLPKPVIEPDIVLTHWVSWVVCSFHTDGLHFKPDFLRFCFTWQRHAAQQPPDPVGGKFFKQQNTIFSPSVAS